MYYNYMYKFPLLKKLELIAVNLESGFSNKSESNSISGNAFLESNVNVSV